MNAVPQHLDARFRERAARRNLLDVAYDVADSPIGPLLVASTPRGLCEIAFDAEPEREVERLAARFGTRVLHSPRPLARVRRELDQYFAGRRREFDLPVDIEWLPVFQRSVLEELARVPYGRTETYGSLAGLIGRPRAARAVGGALNRNPIPIVLPCHRVVGASGSATGYGGGLHRKEMLLKLEGAFA